MEAAPVRPGTEGVEVRRFACTGCGRCCDRGPEMELSEATALAGTFLMSMIFKVHSLPVSDRAGWATAWWQRQESRVPLRPALEERRRLLGQFASRKRVDRTRDRQLFFEISAIVDDDGRGRCPALVGDLCGIYDDRPLTCRTVPFHYSRAPSTLRTTLDRFTQTPGYRCDTGATAPIVLDGSQVRDRAVAAARDAAAQVAKREQPWKERLLTLMDDPDRARQAGLPTFDGVLASSDQGYASVVPMFVAWRVAAQSGLLSAEDFAGICSKQIDLLHRALAGAADPERQKTLRAMVATYQAQQRGGEGSVLVSGIGRT